MHANNRFIKDGRDDYDDEDEIASHDYGDDLNHLNDTNDDYSESSESDSDSSDYQPDEDGESAQNEAGSSSRNSKGKEQEEGEEEEEEDEVIKAILKSKELCRNHPPSILLEDPLSDICFHPESDIIALASITGDIFLYKYNNEETVLSSTLELHDNGCRDVEFSQDGKTLYSAGKDKTIFLSDVETEKLSGMFEDAHEHPIYSLFIVNENTFASGDDEGTVRLWDQRQKSTNPIFSIKEMEDYVSSMLTNEDKKYLVCASGDGTLTTLNLRGKQLHVRTEDYPEELTSLGLFKSGRKILAGGTKGNLYLFNWNEFGLHSDVIPSFTKKSINCLIPITENIVVTGGEDKKLRALNLFPNQQLGIVGQHDLSVECLDICNDGTIIASYSYDNSVRFWNISYFESLNVSKSIKGGKQKKLKHNLPSSKQDNVSDFFEDL